MLKFYPKILYKIDDFDYLKVTDVGFYYKIKDFISSFASSNGRPHIVQNGETPSSLSYRVYGNSKYDYSIMLLNDIRNLYDEWPRGEKAFNEYIVQKYGSVASAKNTQAVYYRSDGKKLSREAWLQLLDGGKYFDSQYDYETKLNDEKAKIKLVDFNYIIAFEVELRQLTSKLIAEELNKVQG